MSSRSDLYRNLPGAASGGASAASLAAADLQRGLQLHQSGALDAAETAYRAVLQRLPKQADALHLLGVVHHQRGDSAKAVDLIRRAIKIDDSNPHAVINLGAALHALGRLDEAETTYRAALRRLPDNPEIHGNLAGVLQARGDRPGAIAAVEKALSLAPARPAWQFRLADLLLDEERYEESIAAFRAYLAAAPDDVLGHNNLGVALEKLHRYEEAAAQFRIVVQKRPELAEGHANLGNACSGLRLYDEAEAAYRRAVELDPAQPRIRLNLANLLLDTARIDEALSLCTLALSQEPDDAKVLNEVGARLVRAKRAADAVDVFRRAVALDPDFADAHDNLGHALTGLKLPAEAIPEFRECMRLDPAASAPRMNLLQALRVTHQWDEAVVQAHALRACAGYDPRDCEGGIVQVFKDVADFDSIEAMGDIWEVAEQLPRGELAAIALMLLAMADDDAKVRRLAGILRRVGQDLAAEAAIRPLPPLPARPPLAGRKVNVGFLSADFRNHSVAKFVLPVFRHCDRDRFQVFAYSAFPEIEDKVQAEIRASVDLYRTVNLLSDREVAQQVRDDGVDILFDLNGYTAYSRLSVLNYRAAPIQASWMGWPATTGMDAVDYFLCDHFTRPLSDDYLVEKPLEMSGAFVCFESFPEEPLTPPPFLSNGFITFGTLNAVYKYSRNLIACWAEVMRALEGSRLVIVRPEARSLVFLNMMVDEFARHGISRDRLDIINNHFGSAAHLSYYNNFDMSLDTFPVTGGTTTTDALWMGVPVVSMMGPAYHQRIGGGIARHCGLDDLCVTNEEDYVRTAIALASDRDRLVALRQNLRPVLRETPLCRVDKFMAGFHDALTEVAQRHLG